MILRFELIAQGWRASAIEANLGTDKPRREVTPAAFLKQTVPIHEQACFKSMTAGAFMLHQ